MDEKNNIRNFVIISHIDHGKSTLADRFLEITKTIPPQKMRPQYLDLMDLERERGITIKMQPVRMTYILNSKSYILNLIDTPGHVDFSYEVSRSLAAVEGAILLVDASKGIQAQTISNLQLAQEQNLAIIPVINKIDLPQVNIEQVEREISDLLKIDSEEIIKISAKYGTNVENLLQKVIEKIPPPKIKRESPFRALIFDSQYDSYKGVIAFIRVFEGEIKKGEKFNLFWANTQGEVKEVGFFNPELRPAESLKSGDIGFLTTGIKQPGKVRVGDTIIKPTANSQKPKANIEPLPGYKEPKPMIFASIYPENPDDFECLKESLEKLKLNDPSLCFKPESKQGLGRGFHAGFLGLLHAEIVAERLRKEFALNLILTAPSLVYKIMFKDNKEVLIDNPADWPDNHGIKQSQEIWIKLHILTPSHYLGGVVKLLDNLMSHYIKTNYLGQFKVELIYETPLREIIAKNFYDKLKSVSQGFASMDYEILGWRKADLVKLDILISGKKEEAFSKIVPKEQVYEQAKEIVEKLKKILPPQLFALPIQAAIGGKIIKRETLKARRKDVTAPLYGGDFTRKRKLLEKQKKGKKKLKEIGRIKIPPKVFLEIFKT